MGKARILIVEDDYDNYIMIRFLLERAGYEVLWGTNGREGLEVAYQEIHDLILIDLAMPEMDGWTAARELKSSSKTKEIPLVALSAFTLPGDQRRFLEAGCDIHISKPVVTPEFLQ